MSQSETFFNEWKGVEVKVTRHFYPTDFILQITLPTNVAMGDSFCK